MFLPSCGGSTCIFKQAGSPLMVKITWRSFQGAWEVQLLRPSLGNRQFHTQIMLPWLKLWYRDNIDIFWLMLHIVSGDANNWLLYLSYRPIWSWFILIPHLNSREILVIYIWRQQCSMFRQPYMINNHAHVFNIGPVGSCELMFWVTSDMSNIQWWFGQGVRGHDRLIWKVECMPW